MAKNKPQLRNEKERRKAMWNLMAEAYNALEPEKKVTGEEMSRFYHTPKDDKG